MSRPVTSLTSPTRRQLVEQMTPCYRQASFAQKSLLLDRVVATTGYARKYAIHLLNESSERTHPTLHPRLSQYPVEMQHALLLAWKAAHWICAKRLIPFLPTLIDALERHGRLQLTQENRNHLLRVSPATAERLLHERRQAVPRGLCTTKAGPLLKSQIPIRTFEQWDDTRPGFLEADLVAHGGGQPQGSFLYTLTLTDIATGWTECLPLRYRSPEAVEAALKQARRLFPFPILGIDTDNGKEFLNETILAYCEREHITFTRGRPQCKNDQCFIEQKNGAVVRQFVGYDRFVGEAASRQLRELYRALRLYVNCFQPSMKLHSKYLDGERLRRVYDPAKTPLQRLLLSGSLSVQRQHELSEAFHALDPLGLLEQVESLQQAFVRYAVNPFSPPFHAHTPVLLRFSPDQCFSSPLPAHVEGSAIPPMQEVRALWQEENDPSDWLDWPHTTRDPFAGQWKQILRLVLAHPDSSSSEIFQQLQQQSAGRYHLSQLGTLQRGVRLIRAHLLQHGEERWPHEVIQATGPDTPVLVSDQQKQEADPMVNGWYSPSAFPPQEGVDAPSLPLAPRTEAGARDTIADTLPVPNTYPEPLRNEERQEAHFVPLNQASQRTRPLTMTIEQAITSYLQDQVRGGRSPKTMEWHQIALGFFQRYLVSTRHLVFPHQITEKQVRGWLAFLRTTPTSKQTHRATSTIATYARSARAFCRWLQRQGYLQDSPFSKGTIPKVSKRAIQLIEPAEFEQLLHACQPGGDLASSIDWATSRNCAILRVFFETGMRVAELCALRLRDVDQEQGRLRMEREHQEHWITLSPKGWEQLRDYLDHSRLREEDSARGRATIEDHLFLSERYEPLTPNAITLLFARLRKRMGSSDTRVSPSAFRQTFAVQYLQTGGDPEVLRDLLGLADINGYQRLSVQLTKGDEQNGPSEEHLLKQCSGPHTSKQHSRKPSSIVTKKRTQRVARSLLAELATCGENDPEARVASEDVIKQKRPYKQKVERESSPVGRSP